MEAILTSYMYIEFDKIVYFYSDYARKDIGGKRIERYVLQKFIVIVTVLTLFCSIVVTSGSASAETVPVLDVEAGSAILVEANSGKILYEKNADESLAIASMTKMMSEYLVHEAVEKGKLKWDQKLKFLSMHIRFRKIVHYQTFH